jgi:hypothetical protein
MGPLLTGSGDSCSVKPEGSDEDVGGGWAGNGASERFCITVSRDCVDG